ncbi:MAG: porin family protein [Campylobacter sp.]|nr:porin family protein [Campylobacter sp.]
MKKIFLKSLVASSLLASLALADDGVFIGLQTGYNFQSRAEGAHSEKYKDKNAEIGFKAGYDFDMFRAYGSYYYETQAKDKEAKWRSHNFIVGGDYTPMIFDDFKAVVGAYIGVAKVKLEDTSSNGGKDSDTGVVYGGKLGGAYDFDEHNQAELGFKAERLRFDTHHVKADINNYGIYMGYNFKF